MENVETTPWNEKTKEKQENLLKRIDIQVENIRTSI